MKRISIISVAALAFTAPAHALVIDTNTTLDLSQSTLTPFFDTAVGFTPISATVAEGDTWNFTVDFLGNQQLTVTNLTSVWLTSFTNVDSTVHALGTISFLDLNGNTIYQSNPLDDNEAAVHLGQFFGPSNFTALPSSLTFGGLRYSGKVLDYSVPGVISRTYAEPYLSVYGSSVTLSETPAVPEPATWAMMISGFGLIGASLRRQKVAVSFA